MTGRLAGRVIIVTGGASGLGEGIVRRAAAEGGKLVVADRDGARAEALAAALRDEGLEAMGVAVDVAERGQVRAMVEAVTAHFGGIDVLFNNAGFNKPLPFLEVDEDNFSSIMRVNAFGVMIGMQEIGRHMIARGQGGKIINTASIAGRQGYPEFAPYCASKAAVISLTQAAAREFASHKITVNGIAPGVVVTPLWDGLERDMIEKGVIKERGEFINSFSAGILAGRPATPDDLTGLTTFLASGESDYMTGQIIMCDGGMVLV
jgi:meso-butanediol dehydrogenase/(S,S)-butanediol dehydrogenase/diacetyl reductase